MTDHDIIKQFIEQENFECVAAQDPMASMSVNSDLYNLDVIQGNIRFTFAISCGEMFAFRVIYQEDLGTCTKIIARAQLSNPKCFATLAQAIRNYQ